ncbi:ribonuclease R [Candidatus Poseidoniaceae archaeon]|nr:ribonuclease R [Candidatus Poseidoniaceae archaeon]|tara:strand:+ start:1557 stop:3941 length:2385 start_codon:yes stop_codon:yes gene_type:complete
MAQPRNRGKNKHNKRNKGPQSPPDERLWRRLCGHFKDDEHLWNTVWDGASIAEFLIEKEQLEQRFKLDPKVERSFRSELDQTIATARSKGERFAEVEEKGVQIRTPAHVEAIEANVRSWQSFSSLHAKGGSPGLSGLPALKQGDAINAEEGVYVSAGDAERYAVLERVWMAHLAGEDYPDEFTLVEGERIRTWGSFDLAKEARFIAKRRSGLRFHEAEPSMALLLLQAKHHTARSLMDHRLDSKRKGGFNPFPQEYNQRLMDAAEQLPQVDGNAAVNQGRADLRHLPFVTIDPHDAKDFDDAVCLVDEGAERTLWVAIADVAHYVRPGTTLDAAARNRATSVYLPHAVLPMLPPKLADDLCSLRAEVDRFSMVIAMRLNGANEIASTEAFEAVINVKRNLAYEDAIGKPEFKSMFDLAAAWQASEVRLNIQNAELRPRLHGDENIRVEVKWPNDATRMIESFMVATNASVGHLLGALDAPLPWRCHAPPDAPEVEALNAKLESLGVDIELPRPSTRTHGQSETSELSNLLGAWAGAGVDLSGLDPVKDPVESEVEAYLANVLDPEARQSILDALEVAQAEASKLTGPVRRVVDQGLFQLMQRAKYSEENLGHFGLNLDAYVHFTSPIRRYPDLMAHRQLKAHLHQLPWVHDEEETASLAAHCSERGHAAKRLEWELVANAYHIHLLRGGAIGEQSSEDSVVEGEMRYNARITGLKGVWVFLDLADDGSIHGRMHVQQLGGKQRLLVDEQGLNVVPAEPDHNGEHPPVVRLGQVFPCRLRGLDVWAGSLDLAPLR